MAANAGVIKAIVSFYRVNSDTAFERHRYRILVNDLNTVHALKEHLIQFLGLKELTIKYGLGDFDMKLYRMAPKPGVKSDNFAITTDDQWKLELGSMLDDSGSEMNSILSACVFFSCSGVNISMQVSPENLLGTATLSEYFRFCFHVMHYVTFIFLEIIYVIITVA